MGDLHREKVWDPVTRLWHWVLVIAVSLGWYFGEFMSFTTIQWHFYCGYTILGLVVFRIIYGFIGPAPIRFGALLVSPREIARYLKTVTRREPSGTRGHNPLGSLSVLAMIALLLAQASSGLFLESDDYFEAAPLAGFVSDAVSDPLTWWHKLMAKVILAVVALHVAAIFFYLVWKKENLIKPMITGWKLIRPRAADQHGSAE